MFRTFFLSTALTLINSAVLAQTAAVPPAFVTCSRIQKNSERLACYDSAVSYLSRPAEQQTAAPSAEASFGLQAGAPVMSPTVPEQAGSDSNSTEILSITARVTEITSDRENRKIVTLDNGQTWREQTASTFIALKVGDEVRINRAALGSFMMSAPSGRPLRVRRLK